MPKRNFSASASVDSDCGRFASCEKPTSCIAGTDAAPNAADETLPFELETPQQTENNEERNASEARNDAEPESAQGEPAAGGNGKRARKKGAALTSMICKIAILTALATVLLLFEFPIFPATPFYQLNFSDVPVLIGTFMFGPWIGALISTLKVLLFFFFKGTSSGFIGEISNIVGGLAFVVPAGLIYGKKHGLKRALVALIVGAVSFTVVMALFNLYALLPWYANRFMENLKDFQPRLILVLTWCVPFNLIKAVATDILTFVLYKATRKIFNMF